MNVVLIGNVDSGIQVFDGPLDSGEVGLVILPCRAGPNGGCYAGQRIYTDPDAEPGHCVGLSIR